MKNYHYFETSKGIQLGKVYDTIKNIQKTLKEHKICFNLLMNKSNQGLFTLLNGGK